jgi:PBP1b-binding outer membrane lipoprotein LpoB
MANVRYVAMILWASCSLAVLPSGCAGSHVRGSENPKLDEMTMSLRLDREDLERLYRKNVKTLMDSKIVGEWNRRARSGTSPVVALFPIANESSEHVRQSLDSLLSKFQTDLVNQTPVDVISRDMQSELIREVKRQQRGAYNPDRLAEYGKQLGAQYYVTGKLYDVAERTEKGRRVQYFLFIQVIDIETGVVKFQTESGLSKALVG